jgi:putative endonuclease
MDTRRTVGQCGEQAAADYLREQGLTIVMRNWTSKLGELDIIAEDPQQQELVIVEVRTTRGQRFGLGLQSVDWRKQQRVRRLATQYMQQHSLGQRAMRFDVVSVLLDSQYQVRQLDHIPYAF